MTSTEASAAGRTKCRSCDAPLRDVFIDLGTSPLSNAFLRAEELAGPETFYPLRVMSCRQCFLVQLPAFESPTAIFSDYAYFSSYSDTWLEHVGRFARDAVDQWGLDARSLVLEIGSNDGGLLAAFQRLGIRVLGVEPAKNVAARAVELGIPTITEFFDREMASRLVEEHGHADLVVATNVLAQVPELNGFVAGLRDVLAPRGILSIEVPHLLRLIADTQFDTIYHEHFSYFSFASLRALLERHGLNVIDVQRLSTHGGSLRVLAAHARDQSKSTSRAVASVAEEEARAGLNVETFREFAGRVEGIRRNTFRFLSEQREQGREVVGYGAPAKGNTFLNYCGIRSDLLRYTVDRSPHKQGLFLPGSRIPISAPEKISETRPAIVLILPWNLRDEISGQLEHVRQWGGRLAIAVPSIEVY